MKIIAFVGMPGSGKTLATDFLKEKGIPVFRTIQITTHRQFLTLLKATGQQLRALLNLWKRAFFQTLINWTQSAQLEWQECLLSAAAAEKM